MSEILDDIFGNGQDEDQGANEPRPDLRRRELTPEDIRLRVVMRKLIEIDKLIPPSDQL